MREMLWGAKPVFRLYYFELERGVLMTEYSSMTRPTPTIILHTWIAGRSSRHTFSPTYFSAHGEVFCVIPN